MSTLQFKVATEASEFEQIHRLNYRTFVQEIPQHTDNQSGMLVDKFHDENVYIICLNQKVLYGMVALRSKRPFSLDSKLEKLDSLIPPHTSACEIRLLAIAQGHRNGKIVRGLFSLIAEYCELHHHDIVLISGTIRQLKLYHHLGFKDFGPLVGNADALYQPMYREVKTFRQFAASTRSLSVIPNPVMRKNNGISFMPGPVKLHPHVRRALQEEPLSHRSLVFMNDFRDTCEFLKSMFNCTELTLLTGSGTLTNDVIATQIATLNAPGLVLVNGEFGKRLTQHADRSSLHYRTITVHDGQAFTTDVIDGTLKQHPEIEWLWCTHCETSTGVLNDLPGINALCQRHSVKLCVDGISSIGTVPVDLSKVWFASGVSGKGLGSIPGIGLIFSNHIPQASPSSGLRYMDIAYYHQQQGIPFTLSSNLFYALTAALHCRNWIHYFDQLKSWSIKIRQYLQGRGLRIIADESVSSPAVFTLQLPPDYPSQYFGDAMVERGIQVSYMSAYLLQNNRVQICLMGNLKDSDITQLLDVLEEVEITVDDPKRISAGAVE